MEPTVFFLITVGLPVICVTLIIITGMLMAAFKKKSPDTVSKDDARDLQEIHQSLIRLERRIDSLETIYFELDRTQKGKNDEL